MSIFAQHGWGKTDKIERGLTDGSLNGIIMSPRDEAPANLSAFLSSIQNTYPSTERLVDPQLYVGAVWPVRDGKLPDYPHYQQHLTPSSFSPSGIQQFVNATLAWQDSLDVTAIVSPTVIVDDLRSQWAQIALMFAQETITQYRGTRPLIISLVINEDALRQRVPVDDWLNDLTQLNVDGFYLVVKRTADTYRQHYDAGILAPLLGVCYSLAELNDYRLYMGYTDMVTAVFHAVGVTATSAGWFTGLRQFTLRRFQPVSGGRRPRSRYSSHPLLNTIYVSELDSIYYGARVTDVLSGTPYDGRFNGATNPENVAWPDDDAALHHWHVLHGIAQSATGNTVSDRLDSVRDATAVARAMYAQYANLVPFTTETGSTHLDQWLDGLNRFRSEFAV